ncbi:MAG: energy-coupling factor transporter ATPase, partial [Clostridia bacterium]|nr:energy-coupling factor transporter ATPase [Clostridia bacterium]
VAIAGVIAMRPELIIFDEATSMLDPSGREDIFELAKALNETGTTVIWITHFMEEAARCDSLYVIEDGSVAMQGTPKQIFAQGDRLRSLGLDVPDMTKLACMLNDAGLAVPRDILTIEEMEVELCRLA